MPSSKNNYIYIFLIVLAVTSFIYGFGIKENSAEVGFEILIIHGTIKLHLMKTL